MSREGTELREVPGLGGDPLGASSLWTREEAAGSPVFPRSPDPRPGRTGRGWDPLLVGTWEDAPGGVSPSPAAVDLTPHKFQGPWLSGERPQGRPSRRSPSTLSRHHEAWTDEMGWCGCRLRTPGQGLGLRAAFWGAPSAEAKTATSTQLDET